MNIGPFWIHRLEQWDLDCKPIFCVHKRFDHGNGTRRVLCVYIEDEKLQIRKEIRP